MSNAVFNARFTPTSSTVLSPDEFQVVADIFDGNGQFSGTDVDVDDVVFLDTFASLTAPATISRYYVQSIVTQGPSSVEVVLKYEDTGTPVDPGEVSGNPGYIARRSLVKKYAYHAPPTIHTIPDYVTQYARDYDNYIKLEVDLQAGSGSGDLLKGTFTNNSGSTIPILKLVKQNSSGVISPVDASVEADVENIVGVTMAAILNTAAGDVGFSGLIKNVTTSFLVGDVIYLSKTGGYISTAPEIGSNSFVAADWVVRVGQITKNSTNPSNKDFKLEIEVIGQL